MEDDVSPSELPGLDPVSALVLSDLPAPTFAFAYGSGVFPQLGVKYRGRRMLDLVIAVDDAEQWHARNMEKNPGHYAWYMRFMGSKTVARVQKSSFGAGLYYNTLMPTSGGKRHFKYGVITVDDMLSDLRSWKWMYVAGRTHKPIHILTPKPLRKGLATALEGNVEFATATALLTLSAKFTEEDIYTAAASLSYVGDVRMVVAAEVASKVPAIVKANLGYFRGMYARSIDALGCVKKSRAGLWERDVSPASQKSLLRRLPAHLQTEIKTVLGKSGDRFESVADKLGNENLALVKKAVVAAVGAIVTRSSMQQSIKGIFTAGAATSTRYALAKLSKSLAARLKTYNVAAFPK